MAEEPFYDTRAEEWTRNRFFAGIEKKLGRNCTLDLYYCRQHDFHTHDPNLNVIGISMRVNLDLSTPDAQIH